METTDILFCPECGERVTKWHTSEGDTYYCKHCQKDIPYKETKNIRFVLDGCEKELKLNLKGSYINPIINAQGNFGIAYESLSRLFHHGKFKYPWTHKYKNDLILYVRLHIANEIKQWKENKW